MGASAPVCSLILIKDPLAAGSHSTAREETPELAQTHSRKEDKGPKEGKQESPGQGRHPALLLCP